MTDEDYLYDCNYVARLWFDEFCINTASNGFHNCTIQWEDFDSQVGKTVATQRRSLAVELSLKSLEVTIKRIQNTDDFYRWYPNLKLSRVDEALFLLEEMGL